MTSLLISAAQLVVDQISSNWETTLYKSQSYSLRCWEKQEAWLSLCIPTRRPKLITNLLGWLILLPNSCCECLTKGVESCCNLSIAKEGLLDLLYRSQEVQLNPTAQQLLCVADKKTPIYFHEENISKKVTFLPAYYLHSFFGYVTRYDSL